MNRKRAALLVVGLACAAAALGQEGARAPRPLGALRAYIKASWATLTRSVRDLPRAAPDPKQPALSSGKWPVYVSARESLSRVREELAQALAPDELARLELRRLPSDPRQVREHGLLYLPRPYVVPGGRFNEMYGWDSYFIQLGLLRDGETSRAKDLADNFLYEVERYGTVLNANRTYYLTRSQPPFLTRMILGVFQVTRDREWLRSTLPALESFYRFWTREPHLIPGPGLSRYFDTGAGPAPEVLTHEHDAQGRTHYERAREYYRTHEVSDYDAAVFYDRAHDRLTDRFYEGDRAMRESGFDTSARFGPLGVDIVSYAPVCLNSLLYQMERDAGEIQEALGDAAAAQEWRRRAALRLEAVDRYLWDEQAGLYFDYNFRTRQRRRYEFATTFFPLWAGLASPRQAARVFGKLSRFEAAGGILTSTTVTGNQWDAPFGWAPLQLVAVQGLRRYGYAAAADRLSEKFVSLVAKEFEEHGTIVEKYDVVRAESEIKGGLKFGYDSNEIGFGWTNAVVLELLAGLEAPALPLTGPSHEARLPRAE